jgi:hypothetical protein
MERKGPTGCRTRMQASVSQMADGITPLSDTGATPTPSRSRRRSHPRVRTDDDAVRRAAVRVGWLPSPRDSATARRTSTRGRGLWARSEGPTQRRLSCGTPLGWGARCRSAGQRARVSARAPRIELLRAARARSRPRLVRSRALGRRARGARRVRRQPRGPAPSRVRPRWRPNRRVGC